MPCRGRLTHRSHAIGVDDDRNVGIQERWTWGSSSPYPRMTMRWPRAARLRTSCAIHAATGVLPVPPTVRLPMLTTGIRWSARRQASRSYSAFRTPRHAAIRNRHAVPAPRAPPPPSQRCPFQTASTPASRASASEPSSASNRGCSSVASRALSGLHELRCGIRDRDRRERLRHEVPIPRSHVATRARPSPPIATMGRPVRCATMSAPGANTCRGPRGPSGVKASGNALLQELRRSPAAHARHRASSSRAPCG